MRSCALPGSSTFGVAETQAIALTSTARTSNASLKSQCKSEKSLMKNILKWILLLPVAIVIIVFAVANRHPVKVYFDPTGNKLPGFTFDAPLYLVLFAALLAGVFIGGAAAWLKQSKHRKAARVARGEARKLESEAQQLRTQIAALPAISPAAGNFGGRNAA